MSNDERRSSNEPGSDAKEGTPSVAPEEALVRQTQQQLLEEAPKVVQVTPSAQQPQLGAVFIGTSFSGPLPPPRALAQYDKVVPGMAGRLLVMAEDEAKNRHHREADEVALNHRVITTEQLGVLSALIVTLTAFGTVIYLASTGHVTEAVWLGVSVIVALATAFIYGSKRSPAPPPADPNRWLGPGGKP